MSPLGPVLGGYSPKCVEYVFPEVPHSPGPLPGPLFGRTSYVECRGFITQHT